MAERTTVYGDLEQGYIVTPTLGDRHGVVAAAVAEHARRQPELAGVAAAYVERVTGILDDAGINYLSVTGRAKSIGVVRRQGLPDGRPACPCTPTR